MKEAVKTGESCTHLNIENLLIVMSPVKELGERIQFDIRCSKCEAKFPETSKKITEKFLEFYGLDKKNF